MVVVCEVKPLVEIKDGQFWYNFHVGQWKVWESKARIILALGGSQSGKTEIGPFG